MGNAKKVGGGRFKMKINRGFKKRMKARRSDTACNEETCNITSNK